MTRLQRAYWRNWKARHCRKPGDSVLGCHAPWLDDWMLVDLLGTSSTQEVLLLKKEMAWDDHFFLCPNSLVQVPGFFKTLEWSFCDILEGTRFQGIIYFDTGSKAGFLSGEFGKNHWTLIVFLPLKKSPSIAWITWVMGFGTSKATSCSTSCSGPWPSWC